MTAATVIGTFFIGKDNFHNIEDAKIATILVIACSPVIFAFAIFNYQIIELKHNIMSLRLIIIY